MLGDDRSSAAELQMLEFFRNLPTTTTLSTPTMSASTATSPITSGRTRLIPVKKWSIPSIEMMETLITDCRFKNAKNCLLKFVYGDKWNTTTRNCSETATNNIVTTTVLSESRMISTVIPTSYSAIETTSFTILPHKFQQAFRTSFNAITTVQPANYNAIATILPTNHSAIETTTPFTALPPTVLPILVPVFVNAAFNIGGHLILILLLTKAAIN